MDRVCVFAHYDINNIIQDYVVYYLSQLKKICKTLIFVSDSNIDSKEIEKISKYIDKCIIGRHEEYDFGSYKRGYQYAKENALLDDIEELVFVNDSCYGPLFSIENVFNKMSLLDVDFWGINANSRGIEYCNEKLVQNNKVHVQSFFIVLKSTIFKSEYFYNFINSVKKEKDKVDVVINYELGLSHNLIKQGFKFDVFCPLSLKVKSPHIKDNIKLIVRNQCPFLKTSIMRLVNINDVYPMFYLFYIFLFTKYDIRLIKKDLAINKRKIPFVEIITSILRQIIKT